MKRIVVGGFSQGGAIALMLLRQVPSLGGLIGAIVPLHVQRYSNISWNQWLFLLYYYTLVAITAMKACIRNEAGIRTS
jgi:hypothetical protein